MRSPQGSWLATARAGVLNRAEVRVERTRFAALCQQGCRNYDQKHSCPPQAPAFGDLVPHAQYIHVLALELTLDQLPQYPNPYHRVRMGNSMLKARLIRALQRWQACRPSDYALGSGSCRACRSCAKSQGSACAKPDRRLFSLEAVGVDCCDLAEQCLGLELEWYLPRRPCHRTVVLGGVLSADREAVALMELLRFLP